MKKVVVSWSGGKDSCLALYNAVMEDYQICYLLNTYAQDSGRVRFHGIKRELVQLQAEAMGIPLLQKETTGEGYEQEFKEAVKSVMPEGVEGVVFGDIYQHMTEWPRKVCASLGIEAIEPLCGLSPENAFIEFVEAEFEAIVVATQGNLLGEEWLGRKLDLKFYDDIKKLGNIDVCGEKGEYHTLVTNGPIFRKKIELVDSGKVLRDGYWFMDVRKYVLS